MALDRAIGHEGSNAPASIKPIRSVIGRLAASFNWRQVTCFDRSYHGLVTREFCRLRAEKLSARYEKRAFSARDRQAISDRIGDLIEDSDLSAELVRPGQFSPWAIKLGRLELARKGQYEMTSLLEEREADLVDCIVAFYSETAVLSHNARMALIARPEDAATIQIIDWSLRCQTELEQRAGADVSRLLRNLGLLQFLAELNHDIPPEVRCLIRCGLDGQRPTTTVIEKACQTMVKRRQAATFAALYRYILGWHQDALSRSSGIATVRSLAADLVMATSETEARTRAAQLGYLPRRDALNDEVLDLVIEYVTDQNDY